MTTPVQALNGVANACQLLPTVATGGQPTKSHLTAFKAQPAVASSGPRNPMEPRPLDEPAAVKAAGLEYVNVPSDPVRTTTPRSSAFSACSGGRRPAGVRTLRQRQPGRRRAHSLSDARPWTRRGRRGRPGHARGTPERRVDGMGPGLRSAASFSIGPRHVNVANKTKGHAPGSMPLGSGKPWGRRASASGLRHHGRLHLRDRHHRHDRRHRHDRHRQSLHPRHPGWRRRRTWAPANSCHDPRRDRSNAPRAATAAADQSGPAPRDEAPRAARPVAHGGRSPPRTSCGRSTARRGPSSERLSGRTSVGRLPRPRTSRLSGTTVRRSSGSRARRASMFGRASRLSTRSGLRSEPQRAVVPLAGAPVRRSALGRASLVGPISVARRIGFELTGWRPRTVGGR